MPKTNSPPQRSKLSTLDSASIVQWTEVAFNIAKITALVAVAGWTVFQWNKVIFPKESSDQFIRKASNRTNIEFSVEDVSFRILDEPTEPTTEQSQMELPTKENAPRRLYISGAFLIKNARNFPIEWTSKNFVLGYSYVPNAEQILAGTTEKGRVTIGWPMDLQMSLLSSEYPEKFTIENGSTFRMPVNELILCDPKSGQYMLVELSLNGSATAIEPEEGMTVSSTLRERSFRRRVLLDISTSGNALVGATGAPSGGGGGGG